MKKMKYGMTAVCLAVGMMLAVTACGGKKTESTETETQTEVTVETQTESETETEAETEAALPAGEMYSYLTGEPVSETIIYVTNPAGVVYRCYFSPRKALGLPIMPPRRRAKPLGLFLNCFIIFCIISYCLSSLFTSSTRVPLPAAMRRLRLGLMMEGFSRSSLVME